MATKTAKVKVNTKVQSYFKADELYVTLMERIVAGVNETARTAEDSALKDVPVRKVFRFGRKNVNSRVFSEQRVEGRQETRPLSLEEALGESILRRKLGLPSAFPTSRSGRRIPGQQSLVRTTSFETYRSKNRANRNDDFRRELTVARIKDEKGVFRNRLGSSEDIVDRGQVIGQRFVARPEFESDLSSRGRGELKRAQPGQSLGGALKRSIHMIEATAGRKVKAKVVAGNRDVDYAKYVEFGTRRSRAQPFMRPALAKAREEFIPIVKQSIVGTIKTKRG